MDNEDGTANDDDDDGSEKLHFRLTLYFSYEVQQSFVFTILDFVSRKRLNVSP